MTLENQVCSLELAKQLKALGCKQESLFWWATKHIHNTILFQPILPNKYVECSAFTVAELVSLLTTVAKQDIIIAYNDNSPADTLALKLIEYAQKGKV